MDARINREIKAFCPDFAPVRLSLSEAGAVFVEVKAQTDYFYHLPGESDGIGTRRLKLRTEGGQYQIIYYYDRQENGARTSRYRLWNVEDPGIKEMLDAALGVRVVVLKSRELWRKDNVVFNLDTVVDVGQIFEVEVQAVDGYDADSQVREYDRLFGPYLGRRIGGSNEDLVP